MHSANWMVASEGQGVPTELTLLDSGSDTYSELLHNRQDIVGTLVSDPNLLW